MGATMARGSQALKGIWALLVDPANKIKIPIKIISNLNLFMPILNLPKLKIKPNKIIKKDLLFDFLKP